jgi:hypothetical protein
MIPLPLHLIYHLFVTDFLTLFLNVFKLQGKDASRSADNWFQFIIVLFTKEYLPMSVLCFLVLDSYINIPPSQTYKTNSLALSPQANYTDWRPPLVDDI